MVSRISHGKPRQNRPRIGVFGRTCSALSTNGIGFMNVREWGAKGVVEGVTELCGLGIAVSLYFYF